MTLNKDIGLAEALPPGSVSLVACSRKQLELGTKTLLDGNLFQLTSLIILHFLVKFFLPYSLR